ncbi:MAG TPA: hypothetical protein VKB59_06055 [Micromonosporaceae bacterium]|nr:hypothetical protein [Micromonosporaceae bacterium]
MQTATLLERPMARDRTETMIAACPEPGCTEATEMYDEVDLASTDGAVAHARTVCPHGHRFFMPVENIRLLR